MLLIIMLIIVFPLNSYRKTVALPMDRNRMNRLKKFYSSRKTNLDFENKGRNSYEETSATRNIRPEPWKAFTDKIEQKKVTKMKFGKIKPKEPIILDELQCKHFDICSGCTIKGNFTDTTLVTRAKNFFKIENVNLNVHIGNRTEWRTHAKLAVQPLSKWGGLKIGLYKYESHIVEPIPNCKVHHPRINEAMEEIRQSAIDVGVKGYVKGTNDNPSQGELRYLQMNIERITNKIQLVLVWNSADFRDAEQTLPRLLKRLKTRPDLWHSITVNFQRSESNNIFNFNAKSWKLLWGPPLSIERIGNCSFFYPPQIFRQANINFFEKEIIPLIVSKVPYDSIVAELYSGIGIIGLNVASVAKEVYCSDSNEYVDEVFDKCADSLPKEQGEKVFFECFDAEDAILEGQCDEASVLIVDPPRRGLDEAVLQICTDTHPTKTAYELRRLIYVSCGYDALESDIRKLISSNKWKLSSADAYILFPGADHIETVAVLDKIF